METLNEDDLDWLTRVENRLLNMRNREAASGKAEWFLKDSFDDSIGGIHRFRQSLQIRFGKAVDKDL